METLEGLSASEIAHYFRWKGDGKETKKLRWKAYRHWVNVKRETDYKTVEKLTQEYKEAAENMRF